MLRDEGKYVLIQTLDDSNYPGFIIDVGAGYLECYVLTNFYVDGNEGRQEAVQTRHRIDFTMIASVQEDYAKMLPPDAKRVASFIRRNVLKIRPIPGSEWSDPVEEVHVKKVAKKSPRLKKKSAEPIDRADQV